MVQIEWSEEAIDDLDGIIAYLSKVSIQYAHSFFERISESIENITEFPKIGRKVPESKNPNYRELIIQRYRLIYKSLEEEDKIIIMTIIHGSRLLKL
ncbi:MAG: type II toxin-antitoxin system RelE/ParE family toxin [Promethearchaeota archaeon]|nr:MAG: type II toxin-antitoxin system RelE/ParE family toxin [Candidatus Lokiarchaeota archaeon]